MQLRRDLLHWERALQMASRLAPDETAAIAKEFAQQLEFTGDYSAALNHYEQALVSSDEPVRRFFVDLNSVSVYRQCWLTTLCAKRVLRVVLFAWAICDVALSWLITVNSVA